MTRLDCSRRVFLKGCAAMAGATALAGGLMGADEDEGRGALMAYVGTFSSPLKFGVDRESGCLAFTGQYAAVGNPSMVVFVESDVADQ